MKPRLLDLFCGAGGCAKGYQMAGFHVTGIDIKWQPRYCGDHFIQGDALTPPVDLSAFDAIHASPPCQAFSVTRHLPNVGHHDDLLTPTRELFLKIGKPWVIENVVGAPMHYAITLCGTMFPELRVQRHRLFETSFWMWQPPHPKHKVKLNTHRWCESQRHAEWQTVAGHAFGIKAGRKAMDIEWMSRDELAQAIPPAYTHYIGKQLMSVLQQQETDMAKARPSSCLPPIPTELDTEGFREAWAEWLIHRVQKGSKVTPLSASKSFKRMATWGIERAIAAIDYSIEKGWTGIYEATGGGAGKPRPGSADHLSGIRDFVEGE